MRRFLRFLFVVLMSVVLFAFTPEKVKPRRKHTFILVHGAWHGAWAWCKLQAELESKGHRVYTVDLPGHGEDETDKASVTLKDYRDAVLNIIDRQPNKVILVGHSMGGVVISEVAEARPEKICKLVYLAAFMLDNGQSLLDIALSDTLALTPRYIIPKPEEGVMDFDRSPEVLKAVFYNSSKSETISLANTHITANPLIPLTTPVSITDDNFGRIRRYYIKTTQDRAISPYMQQRMINALPCRAVFTINADHSPFLSKVSPLRAILERIVRDTRTWKKSGEIQPLASLRNLTPKVVVADGNITIGNIPEEWDGTSISVYSSTGQLLLRKLMGDNTQTTFSCASNQGTFVIVKVLDNMGNSFSEKLFIK